MLPEKNFYTTRAGMINLLIIVGGLLILYQHRYGLGMLNPVNDNWVMKHDWATHHLGWFFYRNEAWTFPIGSISNYLYPVGTNVGFTDSIPIAAIFFKLFSPILPHNFQYLGVWLFGSHVLLAYFTIRLFDQFSVRGLPQLAATLIVVLNPVLLHRSIHPALCSHWIIVGGLWVYFLDPKKYTPERLLTYQGIIFIVGSLINPYLSLIGAGFFVALAWRLWRFDKSLTFTRTVLTLSLGFAGLFVLWYVVGFFSFKNKMDLGVSGAYGLYAFNLNSLYNSGGWSTFLNGRPLVSWHQYESFMYLGIGMIALIVLVTPLTLWRRFRKDKTPDGNQTLSGISTLPLSVFVILVSLFAITNVVTFDDKVLMTIGVPKVLLKIADVFRASARYFWVFYYILLIFVIVRFVNLVRRDTVAVILLTLVLAVQLYDYNSLLGTEKIPNYGKYHPPLTESKWRGMLEKVDRLEFYPPMQAEYLTPHDYMYFSYLAADYAKPINLGYAARLDNISVSKYVGAFRGRIDAGNIGETELFISTPQSAGRFIFAFQEGKLAAGQLDGYYFFYSKKLLNDPAFSFGTTAPEELNVKHTFAPYSIGAGANERNWRMEVHQLERSPHHIFLKASMPKDSAAGKQNLSILLLSRDNEAFVSSPVLLLGDSLLGDSRRQFRGAFATDGLKPGNYRIALLSKATDAQPDNDMLSFFGNLNIGFTEPYQPHEAEDVGRLKWWVETIDTRDQNMSINGWAFLEGQASLPNRVEILLRSENKVYYVPTDPVLRPDVSAYFNSAVDITTCGFNSLIDKSKLEPGDYEIGIRIVNDNLRQGAIEYTNRKFTVR